VGQTNRIEIANSAYEIWFIFGLFLVRAGSVAAQVDNDVDNGRNDVKHDDESEPKPLEQRIKSPLSSMWRRL